MAELSLGVLWGRRQRGGRGLATSQPSTSRLIGFEFGRQAHLIAQRDTQVAKQGGFDLISDFTRHHQQPHTNPTTTIQPAYTVRLDRLAPPHFLLHSADEDDLC